MSVMSFKGTWGTHVKNSDIGKGGEEEEKSGEN